MDPRQPSRPNRLFARSLSSAAGGAGDSSSTLNDAEAAAADSQPLGLFGIAGLRVPQDFARLAREAELLCDDKRHQIVHNAESPSVHKLHMMDDISDSICRVMDAAELCRSVHPEAVWREWSTAAYAHLAEYIQRLNSDQALYRALDDVLSAKDATTSLGEEEFIMGTQLRDDMKRNGVHLDDERRAEFTALQAEIVELSSRFMQNIGQVPHDAEGRVQVPAAALHMLPASVRSSAVRSYDGLWSVPCDRHSAGAVLKWVRDGEVRRCASTHA